MEHEDEARSAQRSGVFQILSGSDTEIGYAIDDVVQDLYEFSQLRGPAAERFRRLFAADARIFGPEDSRGTLGYSVEEFIEIRANDGAPPERELSRRTDSYGGMAQVLSTFERRGASRQARGLNSVHLRHDGARWWIVSLVWTLEDPARPLPSRYLRR